MLLDSSCTTFLKLVAKTDVLDAKPWFFDVRTWISQCLLLNAVAYTCGSPTHSVRCT